MSFPQQYPSPLPVGCVNRLKNGGMLLCPNGPETLADAATAFVAYTVLTQSGTVSVSQLTAPESGQSRALRITQSQASAQRIGLSQAIDSIDCADLRTSLLNASHRARLSVTGRTMFALLEWTGTADAQPADVINDWTNTNYIPGAFFVSTVRVINYGYLSAAADVWASAPYIPLQAGTQINNLIYVVWTESAVAQNATLDLGLFQLAQGPQLLPFEYRSKSQEEATSDPSLLVVTGSHGYPSHTLGDWFYGRGKTYDDAGMAYTGFWRDVTPLVNIDRTRDRAFFGTAVDTPGAFAGSQGSVIPNAAAGADWAIRDSTLTSISSIGRMSITGICKTSLQIASPAGGYGAGIGGQFYLINNGNALGNSVFGWAIYGDVQHEGGALAWSTAMERAVKNKSATNYTTSPYNWNSAGVYVDWHLIGGDTSYGGSNANPITAIFASRPGNGTTPTANVGWVLKELTLTKTGGVANVIHMPEGYAFRWDRANDTLAARIYSSITNTSIPACGLLFTDSGVQIQYAGLIALNIDNVANIATRVHIAAGATTVSPVIYAAGSDTNVSLELRAQAAADIYAHRNDSSTNTAPNVFRVRRSSTGTPGVGIGAAFAYEVETAVSHYEVGMLLSALSTNITDTTEAFDFVVSLMDGGAAAAEKFRLRSTGEPVWRPPATAAALGTNGEVTMQLTSNTSLTFLARGSDGTTRSGSIVLA